MNKVKPLDFEGQTIFCGIDLHKKNWRVNVRNDEFEREDTGSLRSKFVEPFEEKISRGVLPNGL